MLTFIEMSDSDLIVSSPISINYKYKLVNQEAVSFKGALSCLRQILATESLLKMMKNAFNFTLKAFFVLKIFNFLS